MKLQDGTLWIDNSNLAAMYVGDVVYNGTASVYYTDLQDKTILLKSFSYDSEKSRTFPEEDIGSYFAFDLGLDYGEDDTKIEQLICVEPYWRLTLQKGEIIKQEQVVEYKIIFDQR